MTERFDAGSSAFLGRLASYIAQISVDLDAIENSISRLAPWADGAGMSSDQHMSLQRLDHVQQRITDLCVLLDGIAKRRDLHLLIVQELDLAETRALLETRLRQEEQASGDVELF